MNDNLIHFPCAGAAPSRSLRLIGLTGHMGAGKDAAAALLSMVGFQRVAFADQVRIEVEGAIRRGMMPKKALAVIGIADDIAASTPDEVWAKPTSDRMRRILQWWGTEYRRAEDPAYWVKSAMKQAARTPMCVFSDVRFPNEVEAVRYRGGVVWKVERPTRIDGIPGHASERHIDDIDPDLVIANTGTLADLAESLKSALKS